MLLKRKSAAKAIKANKGTKYPSAERQQFLPEEPTPWI